MNILTYPNDHLDKPTKAVSKVTPELVDIAKQMYAVMLENGGIGLAANQVDLDISLIVMADSGEPLILFNPVILKRSKELEYSSEGCLSFPNVFRMIKRPKEVTVKYRDEKGSMQYIILSGIQARCICHEIEHLQGRTFLQHEEKSENKA